MTLAADLAQLAADRVTLHSIIHGTSSASVQTDAGMVPSLAKLLASIGAGISRGAWLTTTAYALNDLVISGGFNYRCTVAHTSGTFATDLAAGKWTLQPTDGNSLPVTATGTSSARTLAARFAQVFNVKDFGALGDGSTDDTTAIQAAITAAQNFNPATPSSDTSHGAVYFPPGVYKTNGLTISKKIAVFGAGNSATFLVLNSGQTVPLITITPISSPANSTQNDNDHTIIADLSLTGNRTDTTTANGAHGIYCPNTSWSLSTQYSVGFHGHRLRIHGFTGSGIYWGVNRNWNFLTDTIIRYCNVDALTSYAYDSRIRGCDFGVCVNGGGVNLVAGGGMSFTDCNAYFNKYGILVATFVNSSTWFVNCEIDHNDRNGVSITGPAAGDNGYSFLGCIFTGNSKSSSGTYSDILCGGVPAIQVAACQFVYDTVNKVKYLVESDASTHIMWSGNDYDSTANIPWATALSNNSANIIYAGARDAWVGPFAGVGTMSGVVNVAGTPTEIYQVLSTAFKLLKQMILQGTNPKQWFYDTDAAANEGKHLWSAQGPNLELFAVDDAEGTFNSFLQWARTGATPVKGTLGVPLVLKSYAKASLPSAATCTYGMILVTDDVGGSTPAFSDGTSWRRVADRAVIS